MTCGSLRHPKAGLEFQGYRVMKLAVLIVSTIMRLDSLMNLETGSRITKTIY